MKHGELYCSHVTASWQKLRLTRIYTPLPPASVPQCLEQMDLLNMKYLEENNKNKIRTTI
jgi:hypothetical protein